MKVSVAICTYNGSAYIEQQLRSILEQTRPVDEIILSDDGSSDDTLQIAQRVLEEATVSYTIRKNETAKGVSSNFLSAMKLATGDYIFTCDQDDVWFPDKVSFFLSAAEASRGELYFSDGVLVDGDCKSLEVNLWQAYGIHYDRIVKEPLIYTLFRMPLVTGAAMMVSKGLVDRIDSIPPEWLHDEWFSVVAALADSAYPLDRPTFYYRQHGHNVIGAKKSTFFERAKKWLEILGELEAYHGLRHRKSTAVRIAAADSPYSADAEIADVFWDRRDRLKTLGRWKGLCLSTSDLFRGTYTRFYTSYRGYLRDVLFILFTNRRK